MPRALIAPTGHSMPLSGGETCVGTDPSVQIPVRADLGLLPRHFVIAEHEGRWHLGAYEGAAVWVNGLSVRVTPLHDGDQIVAGQLELTYRDEPETTVASPPTIPVPLSFPSLRMGGGSSLDDGQQSLQAMPEESAPPPTRMPGRPATPVANVSGDTGVGGRWGPAMMALIGVVLALFGGLACYVAMFELPGPLKPEDLVIKEARILQAVRHQARKRSSWTEMQLHPPMDRVIEVPDDLAVSHAWGKGVAKIGFDKAAYDNRKLNMLGTLVPLRVATLEVNGTRYRSLAKHNAVVEGENQLITIAGPCMVIGGLFLLLMAWEKWKAKRAGARR